MYVCVCVCVCASVCALFSILRQSDAQPMPYGQCSWRKEEKNHRFPLFLSLSLFLYPHRQTFFTDKRTLTAQQPTTVL